LQESTTDYFLWSLSNCWHDARLQINPFPVW